MQSPPEDSQRAGADDTGLAEWHSTFTPGDVLSGRFRVERFIARYGIDRAQAVRVGDLAAALYKRAAASPDATLAKLVEWAGRLHEVGMSISHDGFHKHGAYIVEHADMPGFSSREQSHLAFLVLACRGRLAKVAERLDSKGVRAAVLALRVAVLVHHARTAMALFHELLQATPPRRDHRELGHREQRVAEHEK